MKRLNVPFYPIVMAVFPVLSLFAFNKFEIQFSAILRPIFVVLVFSFLFYLLNYFIFGRNWHNAAFFTGISIILFFAYGHIFNAIEAISFLKNILGRHRIIILLFGIVWLGSFVLSIKRELKPDFTKLMNIFSLILLTFPLIQISWFYLNEAIHDSRLEAAMNRETQIDSNIGYLPDVYYIILDTYARPDALIETYGINVTQFIDEIEDMGFYYANESQSNYGETFTSISSSLNMETISNYLDEADIKSGSASYQDLIIHSEVRSIFESIGYQTVAFSTGYRWSELDDADIFYKIRSSNPLRALKPFENLLFKSSIIFPFRGYLFNLLPQSTASNYSFANKQHALHIETQRNVLEILPEIAINKNPTFTFAHILIPHVPYVFSADGTLLDDPGYYSGEKAGAINDFYELDGYKNQVQFINQQMVNISREILAESAREPIIIIQGDHGWKNENRHQILNLYFFPRQLYDSLYPAISPVNSFRVVFNQFFGLDFPIVEDTIFRSDL